MADIEKKAATSGVSRRSFLQWSAALGGAVAASGLVACAPTDMASTGASEEGEPVDEDPGEWVGSPCWNSGSCLQNCLNQSLIKDGVIVRHRAQQGEDSFENPLRVGCLKGRMQRQVIYGEGRLKYPIKRKNWQPGGGENSNGHLRGIDEWERISWDDALDMIAGEIRRIIDTYGNEAILEGSTLLNKLGGSTELYGTTSEGNKPIVAQFMTGVYLLGAGYMGGGLAGHGNDRFTMMQNTKLIVLFGFNPAITTGTTSMHLIQQLRQAGIEFIIIGPDYNNTMAALDAEWIPCRPSTDTAFLLGVAYHMIENNLQDQDFLDRCTIGFDADHMPEGADPKDNFKDYVLGTYDKQPKTPEWASEICGVPADRIRSFAEKISTSGPMIFGGNNAAHRTHNGQQLQQAIFTVGWMTGNVGKPGAGVSSQCFNGFNGPDLCYQGGDGEEPFANPLSTEMGPYGGYGYTAAATDQKSTAIVYDEVWTAVLDGEYTAMGGRGKQPIDLKMYYGIYKFMGGGWNRLNSVGGSVKAIEAVRKLEFVVTNDVTLSSKSKYADIVLPDTTAWESEEGVFRIVPDAEGQYFCPQLIEPLWEARSKVDVERELGKRLGLGDDGVYALSSKQHFYNKVSTASVLNPETFQPEPILTITQEDIDAFGVEGTPQEGRISWSDAMKQGGYLVPRSQDDGFTGYALSFAGAFAADPENNPIDTESGKLEIYCRGLKEACDAWGFTDVTPIATYNRPIEGYEDTFSDWENKVKGEFPLQMVTPHTMRQGHSSEWNIPHLRRAHADGATMNSLDAAERGIKSGDTVLVSSHNGKILRRVNVVDWVMPGVVLVWHGHQHDYDDETGIDRAGCDNILTAARPTGQGAECFNSTIIQVEKWDGDPVEPDYKWAQRVPVKEA